MAEKMKIISNQKGVALIMVVMALVILAIGAAVVWYSVKSTGDQAAYDKTNQTLELLKKGIMGDISTVSSGQRASFGYVGDMGTLPAALINLIVAGAGVPAWGFNPNIAACTVNGVLQSCNEGAGWKGPYIKADPAMQAVARFIDGWGSDIVYALVAGAGFTLTSYGPNGAAGGGDDVTAAVAQNDFYAVGGAGNNPVTVQVLNNGNPLPGALVRIYYPSAASAVTSASTAAGTITDNGNGTYTTALNTNIPYGMRSVYICSNNIDPCTGITYGPKPISVYKANTIFNIEINPAGGGGAPNTGYPCIGAGCPPDNGNTALNPQAGNSATAVDGVTYGAGNIQNDGKNLYCSFYNSTATTYTFTQFALSGPAGLSNFRKLSYSTFTWGGASWTNVVNDVTTWSGNTAMNVPQTAMTANITLNPSTRIAFELRFNNNFLDGTYTLTLYDAGGAATPFTCTAGLPALTSPTATNITTTTATLGANLVSGNGITARGTCWGTTAAPTTNCLAEGGTALGVYTQARNGFTAGTLYYYRGYATNAVGTGYSVDGTFIAGTPTVTSPTATNIATTSATLGATVSSDGGSALSARGICYGTTPSPTTCVAEGGTAVGVYTQNITGLTNATLYYYRGYATNAYGTSYSADGTFTTGSSPNGNANSQNSLPASGVNGVAGNNPVNGPTVGALVDPTGAAWWDGLGNQSRAYVLLTNTSGANITIRSMNLVSPNFGKLKVTFYDWNTGANTQVANNIFSPYGNFNTTAYTIANGQQVLLELDFQNNVTAGTNMTLNLYTGAGQTGTQYLYNLSF